MRTVLLMVLVGAACWAEKSSEEKTTSPAALPASSAAPAQEPTPQPAAGAQAPATEADCRRVIDHDVEIGGMAGPDGPPPPEARADMAKQCVESGMTTEAVQCFTAA